MLQRNLTAYLGLLLLAVVLRLPAFVGDYATNDESIYWTAGQRIADGGHQYLDTWENKPPIIIWVYALFAWIFGEGGLTALRVFTLAYLFIAAAMFNQLMYNWKFLPRFSVLPGALFLLAFCVPWYTLELNTEQLMALPMLGALWLTARYYELERRNPQTLFWIGVIAAILVNIKFQGAVLALAIYAGAFFIGNLTLRGFLLLFAGSFLTQLVLLMVLYFNGSLGAFYDTAVLYSFDYLGLPGNPGETHSTTDLLEYLKVYGAFLFLGLLGFIVLRGRIATAIIRQRKIDSLFAIWLLTALPTVFLGGRYYLHYMVLALPPLVFYTHYTLQEIGGRWFGRLAVVLLLAFPVFSYSVWLGVATTSNFERLREQVPGISAEGWTRQMFYRVHLRPEESAILGWLEQHPQVEDIWVAAFRPQLYVRLGKKCGTKYTNFSMAYFKMEWLEHNLRRRGGLISDTETMAATYEAFREHLPPLIIDPEGVFADMRRHIPTLLNDYAPIPEEEGFQGWYLPAQPSR